MKRSKHEFHFEEEGGGHKARLMSRLDMARLDMD